MALRCGGEIATKGKSLALSQSLHVKLLFFTASLEISLDRKTCTALEKDIIVVDFIFPLIKSCF